MTIENFVSNIKKQIIMSYTYSNHKNTHHEFDFIIFL